jgi:hypothetical protein
MRDSDRSLIHAIRGPITLITLGILFALNNFTRYGFHQTWPVLLIVFGLLSILRRSAEPAPPTGPAGYAPPAGSYNFPPQGTPAGGYRQSQYPEAAPPAGPAKGGFGSTGSGSTGSGSTPPADNPGGNPGGAV